MAFKDDLQQLYTQTRSEWRKWLEENHNIQKGVWFIFYKKRTDKTSVSYSDAVEEALCFGWIDSVSRKLDEEHHMLMFTPRKPKSPWSGINKERIKKIIKEGRMTNWGAIKIEQAKKDGSWTLYDEIEEIRIPPDLAKQLNLNIKAKDNFSNFAPNIKKGILWWIKSAKTQETRKKRIDKTSAMAAKNLRAQYDKSD